MKTTQTLMYVSAGVIFMGIISKLWLFDIIVRIGIRDQTALRKRNEIRGIYLKIPFPLDFKLYFFNVTNPQEIQNGAKPIVKEIGPYWYDEYKEKIDVVDNDTEDSLTYTPYDVFQFNQTKSGTLREDDYVTIIHPVIVGMVNYVMRDSPVYASIVSKAIAPIFNDPQSIFLTAKVKDILFEGMILNCTSKDFAPTAVCGQMKSLIAGLKFKEDNPNIFMFSILGPRNATLTKRVKILRGIHQTKDLGRLLEVDGKKTVNFWSAEQCNRFEGTDGWIFPPLSEPEEGLKSYSTDLCRNVKLNYVNDTTYNKVHVRLYETDLGDQSTEESEKCYCRTEDSCLKKGLFDLTKCMGVPIYATLPHFLHTDESYMQQVDGLTPDEVKHGLRAYFEPMTGTPMLATKRLQFNFDVHPTKKIPLFSNLPDALFPIFWLEESVELEGDLLKKIQSIFLMLLIGDVLIYMMIVFGIAAFAGSLFFHFKNRKEVAITPIPKTRKSDDNANETNDMLHFTINRRISEKMGVTNHAMSGHEFDRY